MEAMIREIDRLEQSKRTGKLKKLLFKEKRYASIEQARIVTEI